MYSTLTKILKDIERDTGVCVTVFSEQGVILSASGEDDLPAFPVTGTAEGAFCQGGYYFYPTKSTDKRYIIALPDVSEAPTYAVLVAHAIAGALTGEDRGKSSSDLIRLLLSGNADSADVKRLKDEFKFPDGKYSVMALSVYKNQDSLLSVSSVLADSQFDVLIPTENGIFAFVKYVGDGFSEVNPVEFAQSLVESVFAETGARLSVCVGDVTELDGLADSYFSAIIGLKTAFRMNYTKSVFSHRDFIVMDLMASVPHSALEAHRKTMIKPSFISTVEDAELVETAEAFLNCSLNVSETARSLFIHRNTLMYRLNKIERETGLNIRNFSDALAFRVMQMLYKTGERDK